ncbi:MAG: hypothetical protein IJ637_04805 [Prevotella sp.]|nr:hypothetical protein [Prevotella sp.]
MVDISVPQLLAGSEIMMEIGEGTLDGPESLAPEILLNDDATILHYFE